MTSPPLISWLGALFTRIKGGRFVFWVMDLNPDEAIAAGWLRAGLADHEASAAMLNYSLHHATTVVALDRFMAKRIEAKGDRLPARSRSSRPGRTTTCALRRGGPRAIPPGTRARRQVRRHVLGQPQPCHPLDDAARGRAKARAIATDIAFCFVGGGSEFETVRRFAGASRSWQHRDRSRISRWKAGRRRCRPPIFTWS